MIAGWSSLRKDLVSTNMIWNNVIYSSCFTMSSVCQITFLRLSESEINSSRSCDMVGNGCFSMVELTQQPSENEVKFSPIYFFSYHTGVWCFYCILLVRDIWYLTMHYVTSKMFVYINLNKLLNCENPAIASKA